MFTQPFWATFVVLLPTDLYLQRWQQLVLQHDAQVAEDIFEFLEVALEVRCDGWVPMC